MSDRDEEDLGDLLHHWGEAYLIHRFGARWVAQRRDKTRQAISADSAAGLLELIRADYAERPVPRPAPGKDSGPWLT